MKSNTIRGMLNKIVWSGELNRSSYSIVVIDRLSSTGLRNYELCGDVRLLNDRLVVNDTVIPYHRVVAILKDGEVIWRRTVFQKK